MEGDTTLSKAFIKTHPTDAARILERLPFGETASFLDDLSPLLSAEVLKHIDPVTASLYLERLNVLQAAEVALRLPSDRITLLLRRMGEKQRKAILSELPPHISQQIVLLLRSGEGTAGAIMDPQVFTLHDDIAVKEALKRVQRHSVNLLYYIYILNRGQNLVGFVTIPQLMTAPPSDPITSIMAKPVGQLSPAMNRQAVITNPAWNDVHALPVVDDSGVFLGAIEYRTLRQLERAAGDIHPPRRKEDIASAFGDLFWSGLSAFIIEMSLAVKGERTELTNQKRR